MRAPHQLAHVALELRPNGAGVRGMREVHALPGGGDRPNDKVAAAFRAFMETLGLDMEDPNLAGTDHRVARAFTEMFAGLQPSAEPQLSTFPNAEKYSGIVTVAGIPFYSLCAHHFLPFFGTVHVGYVPRYRLLGLSKMARVVEFYARRPQLQERLTEQVATLIDERIAPAGVIVVIEARHLCMEMRGVSARGVCTTTTAARGTLSDDALQRRFLTGLRRGSALSAATEA